MGKRPTKAAATRRRKRTVRRKARAAAGRQHAAASAAKPKRSKSRAAKAKGVKKAAGAGAKRVSATAQRKRRSAAGAAPKHGRAWTSKRRGGGRAAASTRKTVSAKQKAADRRRKTTLPATTARRAPSFGRTRPAHPKALRGRVAARRPRSVEARRAPRARPVAAVPGVIIRAPVGPRVATVLAADALAFVAGLHRRFDALRRELLPDDEPSAPIEGQFPDRRVEVAVDGATFVDFRSSDVGWTQRIERHLQVKDADESAIVVVRPSDLHATERHVAVDGQPVSAALFDFGLCAFHRTAQAAALYCDLSHVQNPREARLWDNVLAFAEEQLGLPAGSIKAAAILAH